MKKYTKYKYVRKTMTWEGRRYEVTGKTEAEAMEKLGALKETLRRGEGTIGPDVTVDRWFREWFDLYKVPAGLTKKSLGMYGEKYRGYIGPAIGRMRLREVREAHLQRILNSQAGRSYSHVSKLRLVMTEMFSRAASTRLIPFDPSTKLELPENKKGTHRSLTPEERELFLSVAQTHRAGLFILTILYAGLRPGEAAALNWEDVDFDRREIIVHKAVESGNENIKDTKTPAGRREVPMNAALTQRMLEARGKPKEPVFRVRTGKRVDHQAIRRMWASFMREVDIRMGAKTYRNKIIESALPPDLTAYCLRHTFCTDLQRSETPINVAKELMGHQDVSTTANIYTHKDQDVLRKFIDKTENYNITETKSVCYADALALAIGQGVADFGLPKPKITAHTTSYTTPAEPVPVENPVEKVFW